jgi:hypothetical protein
MDLDAIDDDTLHRHLASRTPWRPDPPGPSSPDCPGCGALLRLVPARLAINSAPSQGFVLQRSARGGNAPETSRPSESPMSRGGLTTGAPAYRQQ